jgi:hypothetical protein
MSPGASFPPLLADLVEILEQRRAVGNGVRRIGLEFLGQNRDHFLDRHPGKQDLAGWNWRATGNAGRAGQPGGASTNLHVVAVTATPLPVFAGLRKGVIYRYDMTFDFSVSSEDLREATNNALLAYPGLDLPSFCLPPKDVTKLRLIQGSSRMPHGKGADALSLVDKLIEDTAQSPDLRPHQPLLTGDQIYADDIALSLLVMLSSADG